MKNSTKLIHFLHKKLQNNKEYESTVHKGNQLVIMQRPYDVRDRLPLLLVTINEVE